VRDGRSNERAKKYEPALKDPKSKLVIVNPSLGNRKVYDLGKAGGSSKLSTTNLKRIPVNGGGSKTELKKAPATAGGKIKF